ncbi:MAG: hypothetical protein H3C64_02750 [Candidatus Kuenenia stuttgartiensis]|nr:hypothetical protein [Candidatus Kuenenia stuttgartiensis]
MHPYLPHLLSDIAAAHRADISEETPPQTIEEHFEEIDRWIAGEEPAHSFGYYCGLDPENFPPAEQLTDEEMTLVRRAFEKMMYSWNMAIDLPEKLPVAFAYTMIVNSLNEKTDIMNSGQMHLDFCTGYAPDRVFKEYCPCLKFWNDPLDDDFEEDHTESKNDIKRSQNGDAFPWDGEDDLPF